jgi:hypothetical protein
MQAVAHFRSPRWPTLASHHRSPPLLLRRPFSSAAAPGPPPATPLLLRDEHQQPLSHLTKDEAKIRHGVGAEDASSTSRYSSTSVGLVEKEIGPSGETPASVVVLRLLQLASCGDSKGVTAVVGEQGYGRRRGG